jgi:hypothetical protein
LYSSSRACERHIANGASHARRPFERVHRSRERANASIDAREPPSRSVGVLVHSSVVVVVPNARRVW